MRAAVITFPGSNCDRDAITALEKIGSKVQKIWHKEGNLDNDLDLVIVPGGFSYGDYLRSGAMAAISPVMQEVKRLSERGVRIIGICNGFQILTEAGLLDGVLLRNKGGKFICAEVNLKVANHNSPFTCNYKQDQIITIPIAHADGNYFADPGTIKKLEDNNNIAFRYTNIRGDLSDDANPNGSLLNIAGIFNDNKNILGMMPHPERSIDSEINSGDGLAMFNSLLKSCF